MRASNWTGLVAGAALVAFATTGHAAYTAGPVANGGSVKGKVSFGGAQVPTPKKIEVTKDQEVCGKTEKIDRSLLVDAASKGVSNVVVSIEGITAGKPFDATLQKPVIDQHDCEYKPHVVIVPAGAALTALNNDGILHNIHTVSTKNEAVNKAQPKFKKEMDLGIFKTAEVFPVKCDAHGWMAGVVVVTDTPYVAETAADGTFEIKDVPPGKYTLKFWHEKLGEKSAPIEVSAGGTVTSDQTMGQ